MESHPKDHITTHDTQRRMGRRGFLRLGAGAVATALVGAGVAGFELGNHNGNDKVSANQNTGNNGVEYEPATPEETQAPAIEATGTTADGNNTIETAQATNGGSETTPTAEATENTAAANINPYEGREYADPRVLVGKSQEAMAEQVRLPIDNTTTPQGYGIAVGRNLETLFNAGDTDADKEAAKSLGLDLPTYAEQTYHKPLREEMFNYQTDMPGVEGMTPLQGYESYFNRRYSEDSRYTTTVNVEGVDFENETKIGMRVATIVETLHLKITNTFPEGAGTDPDPAIYEGTARILLRADYNDNKYQVNLLSLDLLKSQN